MHKHASFVGKQCPRKIRKFICENTAIGCLDLSDDDDLPAVPPPDDEAWNPKIKMSNLGPKKGKYTSINVMLLEIL